MSDKTIIYGIKDNKRVSTRHLLNEIYDAVGSGVTEISINGCGQHDIGGPLWSKEGKKLLFRVKNPGQRLGSMGMVGTEIIVDGPAPADVGWLNAGAEIIIKGDGGDTTAHCAASGKIFVGGRVGTRSGALMKFDPKFAQPEFWVLKNTGSFSFEFMGGGIAVICGYKCENLNSVLGYRSCVGMVGGVVYVRGKVQDLSDEVWLMELNDADKEFLNQGLPIFLNKIDKSDIAAELIDMGQWKKIIPKTLEERMYKPHRSIKDFRENVWVEKGIFGDLIEEDFRVSTYVGLKESRLKYPEWINSRYSAPCEYNCPTYIPTQKRLALLRQGKLKEALELVLEFSPFPASVCGQVCPNLCMDDCSRKYVDVPVRIKELGLLSKDIPVGKPELEKEEKVAVIGSGSAGLTAAYHLRRMGYSVDVFEEDSVVGGKLTQVIPEERLDREILNLEIKRILDLGVNVHLNQKIDKDKFNNLVEKYDAVVSSIGAHSPINLPVEGNERIIKGLDFLKQINKGEKPAIGKKVVVIGAGNAGMDVVIGAYHAGAESVTAIDIQRPAAFDKEIEHAKNLGAKILWPCFTEKVTEKGVFMKDGTFIEADSVIVSIGDRPDFSFIPSSYLDEKGKVKINEYMQSTENEKLFITGDSIKLGLFTHALGDGRKAAINVDNMFNSRQLNKFQKSPIIPQDKVKKEFYYQLNLTAIEEIKTEEETNRCMSCGYCRDCSFCLEVCPEQAITRNLKADGSFEYVSSESRCIGCGICAGVCPCGIWVMHDNTVRYLES